VATDIEAEFASAGHPGDQQCKNYRTDPTVPLLIPEVNPDHIELIRQQTFTEDGFGLDCDQSQLCGDSADHNPEAAA
jgi:aspartate-semialdehyde dehydrogenase